MASKNFSKLHCGWFAIIASFILPISDAAAQLSVGRDGAASEVAAPVSVSVNLLMPEVPASLDIAGSETMSGARLVPDSLVLQQFGAAADQVSLERERGGRESPATTLSSIVTNGSAGNNRAVDVVTGSNAIREGSFANASGIPVVIQNTGANVLIQNSTIVNVQLR